jgi:outer membrane lipoprotein-sorting protein
VLLIAACAAGAAAQNAAKQAAALPSADQVLERYIRAIGGRVALQKLTTRVATGTLDRDTGESYPAQMWQKGPAKFRFELALPDNAGLIQACDGAVAWDYNSETGTRELDGEARANRLRNSQFHRDMNLKQIYKTLRVSGKDRIGELAVFTVEATPAEGKPDIFYFAADSGLLLRRDSHYVDNEQDISFETYYEDYREVDGVKLPFSLRRRGADGSNFTIHFTSNQHNLPVEDAKFAKPM